MKILIISKELELLGQIQTLLNRTSWNLEFISDLTLAKTLIQQNPNQFASIMLDDTLIQSKNELEQFKNKMDVQSCFILFHSEKLKKGWDDYEAIPAEQSMETNTAQQLMDKLECLRSILHKNKLIKDEEQVTPILHIDELTQEVIVSGEKLGHLTPKEFDLLLILVQHPRQVLTRERLLQHVWHEEVYVDTRTVDTHIKMIRKKLPVNLIKTVWGRGYKFEE
ncbi:response regulator transcription factor [Weissella koreensis]|uniref:response regulator transcription factor n=1 Tax=Weissella koreensis TaxID=165096 RepID=UPI0002174D00|nr:response regulator transcription factor [Weissella koreensis]AEJ23884.1 response regulator [Weissella koreensis KACC 15510]MCZ9311562.1 response regulator transcription factor [Weissella koreensis]